MLSTSLRGELTDIKRQKEIFSLKNSHLVRAIAKVLRSEEAEDYKLISQTIEPVLVNSIASTVIKALLIQLYRESSFNFNNSKKRELILMLLIIEQDHLCMLLA